MHIICRCHRQYYLVDKSQICISTYAYQTLVQISSVTPAKAARWHSTQADFIEHLLLHQVQKRSSYATLQLQQHPAQGNYLRRFPCGSLKVSPYQSNLTGLIIYREGTSTRMPISGVLPTKGQQKHDVQAYTSNAYVESKRSLKKHPNRYSSVLY